MVSMAQIPRTYLLALILAHLLSEAGCIIINCELDRTRMNFLFWTPVASQWPFKSFLFKNVSIFICSSPSSSLSEVSQFIKFEHVAVSGYLELRTLPLILTRFVVYSKNRCSPFIWFICL